MQHLQLDDHVTEQLSFGGVGERALIIELVDLADIVQECSRQQKVAIDLRIKPGNAVTQPHQRDDMLDESSDESMVQRLGGRSLPVSLGNLGVAHEGFE